MESAPKHDNPNPSRDFLGRVAAGDPDAVAELYDRYATRLFRVVLPLVGEEAQAEDLIHDVFVGLPRIVGTFDWRGSFEGWLRRVAVRTALMYLRQQRRSIEVMRRWHVGSRSYTDPTTSEQMDVAAALNQLPDGMRSVFVLKEVAGYSHEEIAKLLGIGVSASKVRLHRARHRLRKYLKGY